MRDNSTLQKTTMQTCVIMLQNNTIPNETGKSLLSKTITGEHTNQIRALQTIVACVTKVAFAK